MLKVYLTDWCPHCTRTVAWLEQRKIPFEAVDMDRVTPEVERVVVDVNGGRDWVVPTLEFDGKWRPGRAFNADGLEADLKKLGVI